MKSGSASKRAGRLSAKAYATRRRKREKWATSLLLIAQFRGADQKNWPWQLRAGLPCFKRSGGLFELDAPTPGNLFTYEQKVVMQVIPTDEARESTAQKPETLKWEVSDTQGKIVRNGTAEFPPKDGKTLEIPLDLDSEKGTFLFHAEIPGKDAREVTFARIPNLQKIIGNGPTPFGGQKFFGDEEAVRAARMMGMISCRFWLSWQSLEPFRGVYNMDAWKKLHEDVAILRKNNLKPWFLLDGIPAWAIAKPDVYGGSFCALPVADADIQSIVTKLSTEFKSDILGFSGRTRLCREPSATILCPNTCGFAGLRTRPRSGSIPILRTRLGWFVAADVPTEPSSRRESWSLRTFCRFITEMRSRRGRRTGFGDCRCGKTALFCGITETARGGFYVGNAAAGGDEGNGTKRLIFFNRFPDELMAGCKKHRVFGGEASPAGDWSPFFGVIFESASRSGGARSPHVRARRCSARWGIFGRKERFDETLRSSRTSVGAGRFLH